MTPEQQVVWDLISKLNDQEFSGWFETSEVMAFVQVESAFRPKAYRFEPRLGEGSYGLMQVLASTARSVSGLLDPEAMYDPEVGLRTGMTVAKLYWSQEAKHFGRDPSLEEWAASYNEGVGGVERDANAGRQPDPAYTAAWMRAYQFWENEATPTKVPTIAIPSAKDLQAALLFAGEAPGPLDGIWGPRSAAALTAYYTR